VTATPMTYYGLGKWQLG